MTETPNGAVAITITNPHNGFVGEAVVAAGTGYTVLNDYHVTSPTCLQIKDCVKIYTDGRVEVDPKYTTTEAARQFWEVVQYFFKTECESCKNSAEKTKG